MSDVGVPNTSPDFYVDFNGDADWDSTNLNAADLPLQHTVVKTKFTELQEACDSAKLTILWSMIDVVDFGFGCISALAAGLVFSNDSLRRSAKISKLQMKYECHVVQLSIRNL